MNQEFEIISYLTTPPTPEELKILLQKLSIPAIALVRQKEKIWIENYKEKTLTEAEIILILSSNPILIERPIIVSGDRAIIAREESKILDFLKD
jgi:arsenate reductase